MKKELALANLKREYNALDEKYEKLGKYLNETQPSEIGEDYYGILFNQLCAMKLHLNCLDERICYIEYERDCSEEAKEKPDEKAEEKDTKEVEEKESDAQHGEMADMLKLTENLNKLIDKVSALQQAN